MSPIFLPDNVRNSNVDVAAAADVGNAVVAGIVVVANPSDFFAILN